MVALLIDPSRIVLSGSGDDRGALVLTGDPRQTCTSIGRRRGKGDECEHAADHDDGAEEQSSNQAAASDGDDPAPPRGSTAARGGIPRRTKAQIGRDL
jgi:hypothetical protein